MPVSPYFNSIFSKAHTDLNRPRSAFPRDHKVDTSMNAGLLVPIAIEEVLPGDSVTRRTRQLWRLSTPKFPTMDHAFVDCYNFFIPYRILQTNFKRVFGESETPWINTSDYFVPVIKYTKSAPGPMSFSVGDYMGQPTRKQVLSINGGSLSNVPDSDFEYEVCALQGRGYAMTWNEYFRDVNLQPAAYVPLDDSDRTVVANPTDPFAYAYQYGPLLPVSKVHDYFTSALPSPQRGDDVTISIGTLAPVVTGDPIGQDVITPRQPMMYYVNGPISGAINFLTLPRDLNGASVLAAGGSRDEQGIKAFVARGLSQPGPVVSNGEGEQVPLGPGILPANLYADLSQTGAQTINQLRLAVATQQYLELLARGGNRYRSFLYSFFGVTSPDASLQIPQYLSGRRVPIKISQVIQTSSDNSETSQPLGDTGAYSLTFDENFDFQASFSEYGFILTVACLRTTHTYTQGLHKLWRRRTALDFYTPVFANVGEMPIDRDELVKTGRKSIDRSVFGYQEAYAEYRYAPNIGTAGFRAATDDGYFLGWTYNDDYDSVPYLNQDWIVETPNLLDRSLAVSSQEPGSQLFGVTYFDDTWRRVMPVYSIPGLYKL